MKIFKNRFLEKINKTNNCWNWIGTKLKSGYGVFWLNGKSVKAHRLSMTIKFGKIPKGMCVCNHCDNPSCVNPKHLFIGTHKDNMRDGVLKGRFRSGKNHPVHYCSQNVHKGEDNPKSKLKTSDIVYIRFLYDFHKYNQKELSKIFGVNNRSISNIVNRKSWKHVSSN